MPVEKRPDTEPVRGYRLIERLGAGGFGEVWKCEAPGGIFKAVKFVYGSLNGVSNGGIHAEEELRAFQLIKSIRHPFLLSIDRVEIVEGELVIITELADQNLHEMWEHHLARGRSGIPRDELLTYMQETAEVLDLLNKRFQLQHLDVKPRNLFLVCNHVKVADFGLVNSHNEGSAAKLAAALNAVTPLYAAPELFSGKISQHCDQYSLAIAFQELLTGSLPFTGKNLRQLLLQHTQADPDLQPLPAHDRPIVARALSKTPEHRFGSCMDFVRALCAEVVGATPPRPRSDQQLAVPTGDDATETILARSADTATFKIAKPALPPGVLENHRFVECQLNSPLVETWRTQLADGTKKRVKFLFGVGAAGQDKLKEALTRLQSIHHPALLSITPALVEPGRVVLVTEHVRETLRSRANQCQARKQPGIPRGELVDYLRAAAEVLDYLYQQHSVQHLQLNPRCLSLDNGWLQMDEFGIAQLLWAPAGQDFAQRNARYSAPELFTSKPSRHCDQFSLALIFAEMLTGVHPFRGLGPQSYLARGAEPELTQLGDGDRDVIRRALQIDPEKRWANCTEMLLALEGTTPEMHAELERKTDRFSDLIAAERDARRKSIFTGVDPAQAQALLVHLIHAAGGHVELSAQAAPALSDTGEMLSYQLIAGLPLGAAQEQMQAFAQQMQGRIVGHDESTCNIQFDLEPSLWQKLRGQAPVLEMSVVMTRVNRMAATPIEIKATLRTVYCTRQRTIDLLSSQGTDILDALQQRLLVHSEKRAKDRVLWPHPIRIHPLDHHGRLEEPIDCKGKDLSMTGIGFYLPHDLTTADVLVELPGADGSPPMRLPTTLVRVKRCADGWYEVGGNFRLPVARNSIAEASV